MKIKNTNHKDIYEGMDPLFNIDESILKDMMKAGYTLEEAEMELILMKEEARKSRK